MPQEHNKTVIFLGAGASKSDGAPLQAELFKSYAKKTENQNGRNTRIEDSVRKFFRMFYGLEIYPDIDIKSLPTFEEALGILDVAIARNERYKGVPKAGLEKYRRAIIFSMAQAIHYELDENNYSNYNNRHKELIENLQKNRKTGISFISANYDLLVDNAIDFDAYSSAESKIDYCFKNEGIGEYHQFKLMKIHGSMNWLYCPVCGEIHVEYGVKSVLRIIEQPNTAKCSNCRSMQEPVIVPPTYYKDMSNYYLTSVWMDANRVLQEANHIVFCGYSFPDADMHIKYLLKRAEINRSNKLKITVINNHDAKSSEEKEVEEQRFKRFFSSTTQINYTEYGFGDFARDPNKILSN